MGKHGGSAEGGRAQNYPSPLACCSACLLLLGLPLASCCLAYCLPLGLP
ncbi:MAG: hypothetical protein SPG89_03025 [Prevotella sp.]|nr:hypothetical protein [Prevotella sp.]MDY5313580.1 hypothetical protein [Prevotella sp.]